MCYIKKKKKKKSGTIKVCHVLQKYFKRYLHEGLGGGSEARLLVTSEIFYRKFAGKSARH